MSRTSSTSIGFPRIRSFKLIAFQFLHDNEGMPFVVVDVVNGADAGMVQLRGGAGFADESVQRLLVMEHVRWNKLEGDVTGKTSVFRLINHAHATTTELSYDVIVGDCLADHSKASVPSAVMLGREQSPGQPLAGRCAPNSSTRCLLPMLTNVPQSARATQFGCIGPRPLAPMMVSSETIGAELLANRLSKGM